MKTKSALAILTLALVLAACASSASAPTDASTLTDLGGVGALQSQFNEESDNPRLILILSPT